MQVIFDQVMAFFGSAMGMTATIAMILDFVLRMIPTQKPASVLYSVAAVVKMIGQIFNKLGEFMDKILPQKIAEPKA